MFVFLIAPLPQVAHLPFAGSGEEEQENKEIMKSGRGDLRSTVKIHH